MDKKYRDLGDLQIAGKGKSVIKGGILAKKFPQTSEEMVGKINKSKLAGIFVYALILFVIGAIYFLGSENKNITMGGDTTAGGDTISGDLKLLSMTYEPKPLHEGEKGNFTFIFSWDGDDNSKEFAVGLYVDNVLADEVTGRMDAYSSDEHSLYWMANDAGEKKISVCLDFQDKILERNESNNNKTLDITVHPIESVA